MSYSCFKCGAVVADGFTHTCPSVTAPVSTGYYVYPSVPSTTVTLIGFSQADRDRLIRIEEKLDRLLDGRTA